VKKGGLVATTTAAQTEAPGQPRLKRVLGLWDLVYYGIILTSPIAAVPLFGEAQVLSHGHAATTLLVAMVAMSVTAVSFGRMANLYPSSGSVYSYISKALNPHIGFILGWAMFLEYLFQPIQNALYAVLTIHRMAPRIPFALLAALIVAFITVMTVQGIKFTARTNEVLLGFMILVTAVFLVEAFRHVVLHQAIGGLFSLKPLYNPARFDLRALAAGLHLRRWYLSDSMASRSWPRRSAIPNATFCWPPCSFAFSQDFSVDSRFTWRSLCGRITPLCKTPKPPSWMWRESLVDPCSSELMELCSWFPAWHAGWRAMSVRRACCTAWDEIT